MSQLQYIRRTYSVPAFRGMRIRYTGDKAPKDGRICCARGPYLGVKFDGDTMLRTLHPTWEVEYLIDPATSPPHRKDCTSLRDDRLHVDCSCGIYSPAADQDYDPPLTFGAACGD